MYFFYTNTIYKVCKVLCPIKRAQYVCIRGVLAHHSDKRNALMMDIADFSPSVLVLAAVVFVTTDTFTNMVQWSVVHPLNIATTKWCVEL